MRNPLKVIRLVGGVLAICAALAVIVSAQAQRPTLTLVSTAWPPFTNLPGQPRFALDLVETAFDRVGISARTTIVAPAEFTPALLAGPYDGSAAAWKDAERERALIFSEPYLENRLVLVGRHAADVSAKSLSDLKGRRVAIVEGYAYGDGVDQSGISFVRARSEEDSLTQLLNGSVDYTLVDELVVQYIVSTYPEESATKLQVGTAPLMVRELYLAVRKTRADAQAIVDRFNAQLRGMIADRTYHRLLHVDWIRADVTGDGVAEYVPASDQVGPSSPQRIYTLFSAPTSISTPKPQPSPGPGFYVGGNIYSDWASVPESYKEVNPRYPDPRRSTASVFQFSW